MEEFGRRKMEFILEVLNYPTYLEDLTGITELLKATEAVSLGSDDDDESWDVSEVVE